MAIKRLTITRIDGTETTVTPNLADTIAFEAFLRKDPRRGSLQQNMLTLQPFRAFSAARREGVITESWEDFLAGTLEVTADTGAADTGAADTEPEADEVDLGGVTGLGKDTPILQPTSY